MSESTDKQIAVPSRITVGVFAEKLGVKVTELMQELMKNGVMATINDTIDFDTASIVGEDMGYTIVEQADTPIEDDEEDSAPLHEFTVLKKGEGVDRPPVIAVMGHVDHGKTTLLDAIRHTNVASGEAGGITQHVSAYQIEHGDRAITFLDTPGHEAFSILREHGAALTDVAIIVVAADDGVKPQTEEAINHVRKAGVRMVVAINKVDKPDADSNRTRQQLSDVGLIPEEWGGDTVMVDISAKTGDGIDKLLDVVLLVVDIEELKARGEGEAEGTVIESQMIKGQGSVATVLVQHGELKVSDFVVAGDTYGKVRKLEDFNGKNIKSAGPSTPVAVSGWKSAPRIGQKIYVVEDEKTARLHSSQAQRSGTASAHGSTSRVTEQDQLFAAMAAGKTKRYPIILKADVDGSLQAVTQSLEAIGTEEVKADVVTSGIGAVNESDIARAASTGAKIIGFNVSIPSRIKQLAQREGVETEFYSVIYELLDSVKEQLSLMLDPETIEEVAGHLDVQGVFMTSRSRLICGGKVLDGKLTPELLVRRIDGEESEDIGTLQNVQREQQVVKEVVEGDMCGMEIATTQKINLEVGQRLEFFTRTTKARSL